MNPTTAFYVNQWIDQLARLREHDRCNCLPFFRPYHFVTPGLTLTRSGVAALAIPGPLQTYASRMQLWQACGLEPPVDVPLHHPQGRFLPLARIDDWSHVPETATALAEITRTFGADKLTFDAVQTSMMEVLENCFAHAAVDDPLKGLACAQSWPDRQLVQIAIADAGIGIRTSLYENAALHRELQEGNACEIATRFGVTSKPELGHAGYGLALTRQLLERAGGRLIVVSGSEWMQARGERCSTGTIAVPWEGTLAVLEWNTTSPLRLKDVYDSWPLPTGFVPDDFDL